MSYVDFEYYQTKYGGSLFESEEDFAPYERKAERRGEKYGRGLQKPGNRRI